MAVSIGAYVGGEILPLRSRRQQGCAGECPATVVSPPSRRGWTLAGQRGYNNGVIVNE